uniref:beta-N-acetylhexosaminidase n=1 Tax=Gouania willdenowi TaxID=441366 RepID=A0A8C5HTJ3_GOUWI
MFPYEEGLTLLQGTVHPTYSREEVLSIQEFSRAKGMEVIPLVQTFGHMEFVLKHKALWELREVSHCVSTLNPHNEKGVKMVMEMLRQVVELHPGLSTLHIGADEVYMLGEGSESKLWLAASGSTVEQLFLSHVTKVATMIKEIWPHLTIIIWDDMIRGMSQDALKASGLVGLVQPMLWDYTPTLDVDTTVSLLEKYCSAGMSELWAASSFKGSTSVFTCVTSTKRHVENHLQWLKVAASLSAAVNLKGIAITGWQRHLKDEELCFVLSNSNAAVESLYPGRKLAQLTVELDALLCSEEIRFFENSMFVKGWFSPYHQQRKMVNPLICMQIQSQASTCLVMIQQKMEAWREEMVRLYQESTAQEWIEEHVRPIIAPLHRIIEEIADCVKEMMP